MLVNFPPATITTKQLNLYEHITLQQILIDSAKKPKYSFQSRVSISNAIGYPFVDITFYTDGILWHTYKVFIPSCLIKRHTVGEIIQCI